MGAFSTRLSSTAVKTINKYGNSGTLEEVTLGEYNPDIGRQPEIKVSHEVKYVKEDYSSFDRVNGLVGINDFKATIAFNKTIQKTWDLDGAQIIDIKTIEVQDEVIIQELQCRK